MSLVSSNSRLLQVLRSYHVALKQQVRYTPHNIDELVAREHPQSLLSSLRPEVRIWFFLKHISIEYLGSLIPVRVPAYFLAGRFELPKYFRTELLVRFSLSEEVVPRFFDMQ